MAELTGAAVPASHRSSPLPPEFYAGVGGPAAICGPARVFYIFLYLKRGRSRTHISGTGKAAPRTARFRLQPEPLHSALRI
jgi:hypothetical protein